jgi:hypothetical protein
MFFYLVTTNGHGLLGAHFYTFGLTEILLALASIVCMTVAITRHLTRSTGD